MKEETAEEASAAEPPACREQVPLQTLRHYLYDLRFEASVSPDLQRHLDAECQACQQRIEFLKATDPVLLEGETAALENLLGEIRVHSVREEEEHREYAREVQNLMGSAAGELQDAETVASLSAQLALRVSNEALRAAKPLLASRQILAHFEALRRITDPVERERRKAEAAAKYEAMFNALPPLRQRHVQGRLLTGSRVICDLETPEGFLVLVYAASCFADQLVEWSESLSVQGNKLVLDADALLERTVQARAGSAY